MIFVECKPDRVLAECLTRTPIREISHEGGKSGVCKKLEGNRNCTGLVDEDPLSAQPPYMTRLRLENDLPQCELRVLHDDSNHNDVVVLCPRLEEWILKAAEESGIAVASYQLPNTPQKLHQVINLHLPKFERLVQGLENSERLRTLKKLLEGRGTSESIATPHNCLPRETEGPQR